MIEFNSKRVFIVLLTLLLIVPFLYASPIVRILSPLNGSFYNSTTLWLNYTVLNATPLSSCWYRNVTGQNVSLPGCLNNTFTVPADGIYNITIYANDTGGDLGGIFIIGQEWNASALGIGQNEAFGIDVDSSSKVYVTGELSKDFHTIKYYANGTIEWNVTKSVSNDDQGNDIAVDNLGNVYVVGRANQGAGNDRFRIVKYFSNGTRPMIVGESITFKTLL